MGTSRVRNPWIRLATDPPFNRHLLCRCHSLEELEHALYERNWCLGQGFYYQNLCIINQINGGDEWLTMRDAIVFESCTFHALIERGGFIAYIQRMLHATDAELHELRY